MAKKTAVQTHKRSDRALETINRCGLFEICTCMLKSFLEIKSRSSKDSFWWPVKTVISCWQPKETRKIHTHTLICQCRKQQKQQFNWSTTHLNTSSNKWIWPVVFIDIYSFWWPSNHLIIVPPDPFGNSIRIIHHILSVWVQRHRTWQRGPKREVLMSWTRDFSKNSSADHICQSSLFPFGLHSDLSDTSDPRNQIKSLLPFIFRFSDIIFYSIIYTMLLLLFFLFISNNLHVGSKKRLNVFLTLFFH